MNFDVTLFNFIYDIILVILFTAVTSFACCLNLIRRRNIALPVIGLFSCYLADAIIIFMTEAVPSFAHWYNEGFIYSPSVKIVLYIGMGFFTLFAWNVLLRRKFTLFQGLILVALGLGVIFIPIVENGPWRSFLFYSTYQVFTLLVSLYGLWKLRNAEPEDYEGPVGWIRALLIVTAVFSLFIMAEDYVVIFHFDNYQVGALHIFNRSVSEDVLRLVYTAFFFHLFGKQFRRNWMTAPDERRGVQEKETAAEENKGTVDLADYKKLKYAQQLSLTEREMEIFSLILQGMSNQQISESLHISMGTVKAHIHNIFQKAEVSHRYELLRQFDAFQVDIPV